MTWFFDSMTVSKWPVGATGGFRLEFLVVLTLESVADLIGIRTMYKTVILVGK